MKVYQVIYNGTKYTTVAKSATQARNQVRYRENLLFAPLDAFEVREVTHG